VVPTLALAFREPDLDPDVQEWPSEDGLEGEAAHRLRKRRRLAKKLAAGHLVGWIGASWPRFVPRGWTWNGRCFVKEVEYEVSRILGTMALDEICGNDRVDEDDRFERPPLLDETW
jgi:hypothetical protein